MMMKFWRTDEGEFTQDQLRFYETILEPLADFNVTDREGVQWAMPDQLAVDKKKEYIVLFAYDSKDERFMRLKQEFLTEVQKKGSISGTSCKNQNRSKESCGTFR